MPKKNRTEEEKEADRAFAWRRYAVRKKAGLCVTCGKEDAYTIAGRSRCADCAEHYRLLRKRWREAHLERDRATNARAKRKKIEAGCCTLCGKKLIEADKETGYLNCPACRRKEAGRKREQRRKAGAVPRQEFYRQDHCPYCGGELAPGKKMCQACIDRFCRDHLKLVKDEQGHWRRPRDEQHA